MRTFTEIKPSQIEENAFKLISDDWMLITAGNKTDHGEFNTMTASWGGVGHIWNKDVALCVIRPQRHTLKFIEQNEYFTLSFFNGYKKELTYCGRHSGADVDKIKETGLTPVQWDDKSVYFNEAKLVLVCKKIYAHQMDNKDFLDSSIEDSYPGKDYHKIFVGEIIKAYKGNE